MADKTAPRVTITHHPDVRRSLMLQKAYAEGLRAVYLYTATFQDQAWTGEGDDEARALAEKVNDLLLPIVKGVGSERAYEQLAQSLQTLGGSGSCRITRSSSTSGTRRSTRCMRAQRRSSRWTSSSARSSGTRGRRWPTSPVRSTSSSTRRAATAG